MVSGVDLKCDCFHILQCTKLLFACFLPGLGREYAHGHFFLFFKVKYYSNINYCHFVYSEMGSILMLHCSMTFQNKTKIGRMKGFNNHQSGSISTGDAIVIISPYAQTRMNLGKYYPLVEREIASHKIDAAMITAGPNADNTITFQPNWLCNTPAVSDATATVAVVIRSAMP